MPPRIFLAIQYPQRLHKHTHHLMFIPTIKLFQKVFKFFVVPHFSRRRVFPFCSIGFQVYFAFLSCIFHAPIIPLHHNLSFYATHAISPPAINATGLVACLHTRIVIYFVLVWKFVTHD